MPELFLKLLRALAWAVFLPLFGFVVFTLMTIIPVLGFFAGIGWLVKTIMVAGFVPSLITALVFEFALRERAFALSLAATIAIGLLNAGVWYLFLIGEELFRGGYVAFALAISTILSVALMPLLTLSARRRATNGIEVTL